jgi:hypothetical protein
MMEIPVVFGEEKNLFGIINQPHQDSTNAVGVIMLTAGMLHHVSSYRFHVLLGRRLEHYGIPSLRFDLSGIGESLPGGKKHDSLHRAATEPKLRWSICDKSMEFPGLSYSGFVRVRMMDGLLPITMSRW